MALSPCALCATLEPLPLHEGLHLNSSHLTNANTKKSPKEDRVTRILHANMSQPFHPRIWQSHDLISSSKNDLESNAINEKRHHELKQEVKTILLSAVDHPFKEMDLVDKIQQLGVGYHFRQEIEDILQRSYNDKKYVEDDRADLYYISLRFRLLRQAGYFVSPDTFNKFKDEKGGFNPNLASDVRGMLSLHEATYLAIHGEDILDDAQEFTGKHLSSMATRLNPPLASQVQRALKTPLHCGAERVHARYYISMYQEDDSRNETLLEFAKLDFNIVQSIHKKELAELLPWWDNITSDIQPKLPFQFRDRLVEAYIICMCFNAEPKFSLGRIHSVKLWCLYTIIDDVHDVYGNIEELRALHDALQRWDGGDLVQLPDHMQVLFHEIKNIFKEIEVDMIRKRSFVGIPYLKKEIKIFANAQFEEVKMINSQDMPTLEAWVSLSADTAGFEVFIVDAVMNLGEVATKEVFDWIDRRPAILTTYRLITRLLDDIAGYKLEKEKGLLMISTVTFYMKEYGVSEREAIRSLRKKIICLWKDMNKEFLRESNVPGAVQKSILGITRSITEYYTESDGDGFTDSKGRTKELIASLLRDPISI